MSRLELLHDITRQTYFLALSDTPNPGSNHGKYQKLKSSTVKFWKEDTPFEEVFFCYSKGVYYEITLNQTNQDSFSDLQRSILMASLKTNSVFPVI